MRGCSTSGAAPAQFTAFAAAPKLPTRALLRRGAGRLWGRHKRAVSNHELKAFTVKPSALHSLITTCLVHWLR